MQVTAISENEETVPTEADLQAKSQEELKPMFLKAIQKLGAPFTSWESIPGVTSTTTIEDVFAQFGLTSQGYTSAYDLIIKQETYSEPYTFTLGEETITDASAEFVVTSNKKYTITASKGTESGKIKYTPTKCLNRVDNQPEVFSELQGMNNTTSNYVNITSVDGITVPIPNGFAYGTSSNVGTVAKGLVITDSVNNGDSTGNEFVWIPVDKTTLAVTVNNVAKPMATKTTGTDTKGNDNYQGKLYYFSGTTSTEITNYGQNTTNFREPAYLTDSSSADASSYNTIGITSNSLQEEYNAVISSIKTYGGFYVARYELGKTAISKLGIDPTSAYETQTSMWYGLYTKCKSYTNSKNSVVSNMIFGSQFDAIFHFGLTNSSDSNKITATTNGNHNGLRALKTGAYIGSDSINNIFDLGGNVYEWTQDAYDTHYRVFRGGYYNHSDSPASIGIQDPNYGYNNASSRVTLCIK